MVTSPYIQYNYLTKLEAIINSAIMDEILINNPLKLIKPENKKKWMSAILL